MNKREAVNWAINKACDEYVDGAWINKE